MKQLLLGGVVLFAVAASLVVSGAFASGTAKAKPTVEASTVTVTAGKPSAYDFSLSTEAVRPGPVAFKVTSKGSLQYTFEICSSPGNADVCFGTSTRTLDPGDSATLSVRLAKGRYEYIGTAGSYVSVKGNLTVSASAAATPKTTVPAATTATKPGAGTTGTSSTGSTGTTGGAGTAPTAVGNNVGDPVAGATLFQQAGCGSCHTLKAAGATGTVGPNLDQVAPDEQTVITNVTFGNAMGMPAFSPQYSTTQIQNIAAYVYNSTH